jgi:hypothetical protein
MNVRYKSRSDVFRLEQQWNTFERIENYDDVIYQRIQDGLRDQTFYQFRSNAEYKDYKSGQDLHVLQNPTLPESTFAPIRDRPLPNTPSKTVLPYITMPDKSFIAPSPLPADEYTQIRSDAEIYTYVSSYNQAHVYKYNFTSDEEKLAFGRAQRRILGTS